MQSNHINTSQRFKATNARDGTSAILKLMQAFGVIGLLENAINAIKAIIDF